VAVRQAKQDLRTESPLPQLNRPCISFPVNGKLPRRIEDELTAKFRAPITGGSNTWLPAEERLRPLSCFGIQMFQIRKNLKSPLFCER
jgi:hypothetical protein